MASVTGAPLGPLDGAPVALKDVQIRSQDGSVFLSGKVGSRAERLLAERVTQSVEGVKKVVNSLSASEEPR